MNIQKSACVQKIFNNFNKEYLKIMARFGEKARSRPTFPCDKDLNHVCHIQDIVLFLNLYHCHVQFYVKFVIDF